MVMRPTSTEDSSSAAVPPILQDLATRMKAHEGRREELACQVSREQRNIEELRQIISSRREPIESPLSLEVVPLDLQPSSPHGVDIEPPVPSPWVVDFEPTMPSPRGVDLEPCVDGGESIVGTTSINPNSMVEEVASSTQLLQLKDYVCKGRLEENDNNLIEGFIEECGSSGTTVSESSELRSIAAGSGHHGRRRPPPSPPPPPVSLSLSCLSGSLPPSLSHFRLSPSEALSPAPASTASSNLHRRTVASSSVGGGQGQNDLDFEKWKGERLLEACGCMIKYNISVFDTCDLKHLTVAFSPKL
ncbi:hypothetical protein Taro_008045 [Colocasia esculenta]|uniref:Uncharacterized protein n=1 Tax=Colocasia esculenta TaxID=4460 RepID=A0A843TWL2_COLES|nr:hypothetical protein [Colocasia esculenta]